MRDVFKLMNHNDKQQSFKREIRMFDKCIQNRGYLSVAQEISSQNYEHRPLPKNCSTIVNVGSRPEKDFVQQSICSRPLNLKPKK